MLRMSVLAEPFRRMFDIDVCWIGVSRCALAQRWRRFFPLNL